MTKLLQIEPQSARGTFNESMWDDPEWVAEEKYDGDRRIAQFVGAVFPAQIERAASGTGRQGHS